jgi:hypothetical protein
MKMVHHCSFHLQLQIFSIYVDAITIVIIQNVKLPEKLNLKISFAPVTNEPPLSTDSSLTVPSVPRA